MLEGKEQNRSDSREVEVEQSSGKIMDISNGRLHHKVTDSSWEECNPSDL